MPAINREELAWAAGLFDGEGTAVAIMRPRIDGDLLRKRKSGQREFAIAVSQAGEYAPSMLRRFQCAVGGLGAIYKIHGKSRPDYYKDGWCWRTSKFEHAQAAIAMMWPWLSTAKRIQTKHALKTWLSWPRLKDLMNSERGHAMASKRWGNRFLIDHRLKERAK